MSHAHRERHVPSEAARAAVVASCEVCGGAMTERKGKHACSGKCRAELSRRRKVEGLVVRDQEIRRLLEAALRRLEEGPL